jgi:lon-related putative ATP-dependent protease
MSNSLRLTAHDLYQNCDIDKLSFASTAELETLPTIIGQSRALDAIDFGVNIEGKGYNLFVMGPTGAGKYTLIKRFIDNHAKQRKQANDWAYLNYFDEPQKPLAVSLPAGQGVQLKHDIEKVIQTLLEEIPHALDDEYYRGRMRSIDDAVRNHKARLFGTLQAESDKVGVVLLRMQDGSYAFAAQREGEALTGEEFEQLPITEQEQTEQAIALLHDELQHTLIELHEWERDHQKQVDDLNAEVTSELISRQMDKLRHAYPNSNKLQNYFDAMQEDIRQNLDVFISPPDTSEETASSPEENIVRRYQINLIVDNKDTVGAPVVFENLPNHQSLIGSVENMAMMGALITDFTLIKAGAIHHANGGYLILDAEQLLTQPYAWDGLKRALLSKEIRFDTLERMYSLVATVSLEPEPIPIDVKVILLGERHLYYELYDLDPEFAQLFKVVADFEEHMPRTDHNHHLYAQMIASTAQSEGLLHLDREAVARIIEQGSRAIEDSSKFSLHMGDMTDLLRESDYWARKDNATIVSHSHVQKALDARESRIDRIREQLIEQIEREVTQITVTGDRVGQINALSVLAVGEFEFAQPSKLSANCRFGDGDIIDIEREVELGGELHSKGMMIMSSYLGSTYAKDKALSVSASLVFEQNYGDIDGDSATLAELCVLLSAISNVPLKQSIAITGSMNQHGKAQAIGGVNEKIEGFFEVCNRFGLTGEQGVVIPSSNIQHLMLRAEVVQAVVDEQFHIYAVDDIDEALSILTGMKVGKPDSKGHFPKGSFNAAVMKRLRRWDKEHKSEKGSGAEGEH